MQLFDARTGKRLPTEVQLETEAHTITFEPDGERLWVGEFSDVDWNGSRVHVLDVGSGARARTIDLMELGGFGYRAPGSMVFREDGELAITSTSDPWIVAAWLPESGRRLWDFDYRDGKPAPLQCAFGRSGERVYVWGSIGSTPRIVSAEDGSTLLDLAGRELSELIPLADERAVAAWGQDGLEVVDTRSGARRWARIETGDDGWLLSAPSLHVDGTREALERTWLSRREGAWPLDALAAALLDPKRVRAAAEGIEFVPARIRVVPELDWVSSPTRVVRVGAVEAPPVVTLVARCPDGVAGFEVRCEGERLRLDGEAISATERRLTVRLGRPTAGEPLDYRWRAVGAKGVLSRALHLTVESGP